MSSLCSRSGLRKLLVSFLKCFLCRNILRCVLTLLILTISKLTESPSLLQMSNIVSANLTSSELEQLDLSRSESMPLLCETVCMLDHFLVVVLMYYVATLFIYLFCRKPNPDVPTTSEMTLRVNKYTEGRGVLFPYF